MFNCKYLSFGYVVFILIVLTLGQDKKWYVSNLDDKCLHCLCEAATGCDTERQCIDGYCGPYKLSSIYWVDADNVTIGNDDQQIPEVSAFEDCVNEYSCAKKIVKKYLTKYAKDCNDDGVTDCYDYMLINFNGGWNCKGPLESEAGIDWVRRYNMCMTQ